MKAFSKVHPIYNEETTPTENEVQALENQLRDKIEETNSLKISNRPHLPKIVKSLEKIKVEQQKTTKELNKLRTSQKQHDLNRLLSNHIPDQWLNIVNSKACYNEQQILKIWDSYVVSKSLKYFSTLYDEYGQTATLFTSKDSMNLKRSAGLVIQTDGSLFSNQNRKTISVSGAVDYISNQLEVGGYNGVTHDIDVALNQVKAWNNSNENTIFNHDIIFSYHITTNHWCLGTLNLEFITNHQIKNAYIKIYNPKPELGGKQVRRNVWHEIQGSIRTIFNQPELELYQLTSHYRPQQDSIDGTSCGVISAENGLDIIDGTRARFATIYPNGARVLRAQHLQKVNNHRFIEMQTQDESWEFNLSQSMITKKVEVEVPIEKIVEGFALVLTNPKIKEEMLQIMSRAQDAINTALQIRDLFEIYKVIIQSNSTKESNIVDLLFHDNHGKLKFKDETVDLLWSMTRSLRLEALSKAPSSPYSKANFKQLLNSIKTYLEEQDFVLASEAIKHALQAYNQQENKGRFYPEEYKLFMLLGDLYRMHHEARDNLPKAVAIYNYLIHMVNTGLVPDPTNKLFQIKKILTDIETSLLPQNSTTNHVMGIDKYIDELKSLRRKVKTELGAINDNCVSGRGITAFDEAWLKIRAGAVETLYAHIREYFIGTKNSSGHIIKDGMLNRLIQDCVQELGGLPQIKYKGRNRDVNYTIYGLGSISLGTMTPWSDIEFGILIEQGLNTAQDKIVRDYFKTLTTLLYIKILNFGETILPSVAIKELNDFYAHKTDDWFFDILTPTRGLSLDGQMPKACKTPLGRIAYQEQEAYELISTPKELSKFQDIDWYETDKHLVQALLTPILISGSKRLLDDYYKHLDIFCYGRDSIATCEILFEDILKYQTTFGSSEDGKVIEVKKDMYRFVDRVVVAFAELFNISARKGGNNWEMIREMLHNNVLTREAAENLLIITSIASEFRLSIYAEKSSQKGEIVLASNTETHVLKNKLTLELAVRFYQTLFPLQELLHKVHQQEKTYASEHSRSIKSGVEAITEDAKMNAALIKDQASFVKFLDADPLMAHNATMLKLKLIPETVKQSFVSLASSSTLFDNSILLTAVLYKRMLDYDTAFLVLNNHQSTNATSKHALVCFIELCHKTGDSAKAVELIESYIEVGQELDSDIYAIAGLAYEQINDIDNAIKYYTTALQFNGQEMELLKAAAGNQGKKHDGKDIYALINNGVYSSISKDIMDKLLERPKILCNIGNAHCKKAGFYYSGERFIAEVNKASKSYTDSISMFIQLKENHPEVEIEYIQTQANYAIALMMLGRHDEALKINLTVLEQEQKCFGKNSTHPSLAKTLNNIGIGYIEAKDIKLAKVFFAKALSLKRQFFVNNQNHVDIASTLINIAYCEERTENHEQAKKYISNWLDLIEKSSIAMTGDKIVMFLRAYASAEGVPKESIAMVMSNHKYTNHSTKPFGVTDLNRQHNQLSSGYISLIAGRPESFQGMA